MPKSFVFQGIYPILTLFKLSIGHARSGKLVTYSLYWLYHLYYLLTGYQIVMHAYLIRGKLEIRYVIEL